MGPYSEGQSKYLSMDRMFVFQEGEVVMCFSMGCPHQHYYTGECRGAIDWNSPGAACRDEDDPEVEERDPEYEYEDRLEDK